ncbi:coiled-coil domain-containing protein 180 [Sarcophilus harrisii]|uniref:Coiled-coil domain containing 180 n=1 Tax=Sarcophilus harrisii TaxID=9305 RepID=A0A7N4NMP4_SARHA|nr:coiled-coil domain-containing protein 180 [Sarcophilus harrisii]XP_031810768.1 coiled-coil domain-containing protein 180 [Sarcophilus harrisii]
MDSLKNFPPNNNISTENLGKMKTVRSGKVYRQIFDDEVQLVRSLANSRKKAVEHVGIVKSGKIPLLRNFETPAGQLLSPRQRMWAEAPPNDKSIENPVLYRELQIATIERNKESEDVIAAREVRGLSDFTVPEKINSDIIQKLDKRRRHIHEANLKNLQKEISQIGVEMESLTMEPGKELLEKLSENDENIDLLFKEMESDMESDVIQIEHLWELWDKLSKKFVNRRKWIKDFETALKKLEACRAKKLGEVLKKYTEILKDIAYLLSPDIDRLIHKEAMIINQALLGNQRAIAKLLINLLEANLKQEISNHHRWQDLMKIWKNMKKELMIRNFREFMDSENIHHPLSVKVEMDHMIKDLENLNQKRIRVLNSISDILPPAYAKDNLDQWYDSLQSLNKDLDYCILEGMMRIRFHNEENWRQCLDFVEQCKNQLLKWKVFSLEEIEYSVNHSFLHIIGNLQNQVENELEMMSTSLEEAAKQAEVQIEDLFKYLQNTLHLWEVHQNHLIQEEINLEKKIEQNRYKHSYETELKEACLDIVLDQMRQQNNEDGLKRHLDKAYFLLFNIKKKYENFHNDLVNEVNGYPFSMLKVLQDYSISISRYFYVREIYDQNIDGEVIIKFRDPDEVLEESPSHLKDIIKKIFKLDMESKISSSESKEIMYKSKSKSKASLPAEEARAIQEHSASEMEEDAKSLKESIIPEIEETQISKVSLFQETGMLETPEESSVVLEEWTGNQIQESLEALSSFEIQPGIISEEESTMESSTEVLESFLTSSGNKYLVFSLREESESKLVDTTSAEDIPQDTAACLKHVILPSQLFSGLKKRIRLEYFEHLEKWFGQTLAKSKMFTAAKTDELDSELELRLHIHKPRAKQIKTEIHNVRAAEILFHQERLDRHCTSILEMLRRERIMFYKFHEEQNTKNKNFRNWMLSIEQAFLNTTTSRNLTLFSSNLNRELLSYVDVIQLSLRGFRHYLEENMEKLRLANMDFLKKCRLFSEGGNFSPDELSTFCNRLEKESLRIEFIESFIMMKMEKMENEYVEQANEIINKFESKFHNLSVDLIFIEKIQRFLTNLQVNIKAEVFKSNFQTETLNNALKELRHKISICGQDIMDQETVNAEDLYNFSKHIVEKLTQRIQYLNCHLDYQGAGANTDNVLFVADMTEEENKADTIKETLLQPSRMGKTMLDDVAVEIIKNVLQLPEQRRDREHGGKIKGKRPRRRTDSIIPNKDIKKILSVTSNLSQGSVLRYSRPNRQDKKYQVFGEKPERNEFHFKNIIHSLLWEANDILLLITEEFYRKDKHSVTRPDYMQDTFDQCVEVFGKKLLEYGNQSDEYYNSCLIELREQLKEFEELLPHVARLVMENFFHKHWETLQSSEAEIEGQFKEQLEEWLKIRDKNNQELHSDLGHPNNYKTMDSLCQDEIKRQTDQNTGILSTADKLEECAKKCARKFINSLTVLTEKLLQQMDEIPTVDDIQSAKMEPVRQKASFLMRWKIAGLPSEEEKEKPQSERGSKKWSGMLPTTFTIHHKIYMRATPPIITNKNSLGHQAVVEARDVIYAKYLVALQLELSKIKEEKDIRLTKAENWKGWWTRSVKTIKDLYF